MKRFIILFIAIGLFVVGCSQDETNGNDEKNDSTKHKVYSSSWDGNPIIVQQKNKNEDYETVNEIVDDAEVKKLIKSLKKCRLEKGVKVDVCPPDYHLCGLI